MQLDRVVHMLRTPVFGERHVTKPYHVRLVCLTHDCHPGRTATKHPNLLLLRGGFGRRDLVVRLCACRLPLLMPRRTPPLIDRRLDSCAMARGRVEAIAANDSQRFKEVDEM